MNTAHFYIHLLQALQTSIGGRLAYIAGQGFFFVETYSTDEGTRHTFHSIDGLTTISEVPKEHQVYFLDDEKSLSELVRNIVATPALHGRNVFATQAQSWRYIVGNTDLTEAQERIAQKYDVQDIAQSYENEFYKQILKELRKLTVEALEKAIRNKKSKKNILLTWQKIQEAAQSNDFLALEEYRDELLRLSGKQKRGENAALIREAKREIRDEIWHKVIRTLKIWTTVVVFFAAVGLGLSYRVSSKRVYIEPAEAETQEPVPQLTASRIDSLIDVHNRKGKNIIYGWRREKIKEYLLSRYTTLSNAQLKQAIDTLSYTKYSFWKH